MKDANRNIPALHGALIVGRWLRSPFEARRRRAALHAYQRLVGSFRPLDKDFCFRPNFRLDTDSFLLVFGTSTHIFG